MASRPQCCLKKCIQGDFDKSMAHVEVKTFNTSATADEKNSMEVNWFDNGEAMFHDICWKAIVDSAKMENPFTLSPLEKEMVLEAKRTAEYFDSFDKLKCEATRICRMLMAAQYPVLFTGAGISTSAGIGDFRGKAGKWTERDREKKHGAGKQKHRRDFVYEDLRPSYTHEALYKLMEMGFVKHIISQNTDCLHRLSGVPRDKLSELHGNSFHEKCEKCGTRYERPFAMRRVHSKYTIQPRICVHCHCNHRTGRICERKGCEGFLVNTIINFGDSLEKRVLSTANEHAKRSDLTLCFGSTLTVAPACDLAEMGQDPLRLVICNRQPTPFDRLCYLTHPDDKDSKLGSRVFGDCDALMKEIMKIVLPAEELQAWEDAAEDRLEEYAKDRETL